MTPRLSPVGLLFAALAAAGCVTTSDASPSSSSSSVAHAEDARDKPFAKPGVAAKPAGAVGTDPGHAGAGTALAAAPGHELAAFALGCFWGSEDTFRHVKGVVSTAVGYTGGRTEAPTYETVCSHTTGHAEAVLVEFDPKVVTYDKLLATFWKTHDPTTKDRQGPDLGDQYRSAIFTFSPAQEATARASMAAAQAHFKSPIVTKIDPLTRFWKAEDYHQQYDEKSGRSSCAKPSGDESI